MKSRIWMFSAAIFLFAALAITVQTSAQKIITIDAQGAGTAPGQGTQANVVSPEGVVTGWYLDANFTYYGFLRTPDGNITTFNAPGAGTGTYQGSGGWGINPAGAIAGDYVDVNCLEHVPSADDPAVTHAVPMRHGSGQHVCNRFDSAMRMPRESGQIVFWNVSVWATHLFDDKRVW